MKELKGSEGVDEIRRFEDLKAWQRARELTNIVYALTKKEGFCKDYSLVDQVHRAVISVMNNIAEGFERGSNKDFVKFLFIARCSVGEVRSILYLALDQNYIEKEEFQNTCDISIEVSRIIWGLIKSLRNKKDWVIGKK